VRTRLSLALFAALAAPVSVWAQAKVNYNEHILPIFRNACLNCHNPDKKKAGLDLSTYDATLQGSENGKVVLSGNAGGSLLFKCCKQTEEPKMPPKGDKLSDAELALLEKWIATQLLESADGKAVAAAKNNVQVAVVSLEKPDGPPPMPGDLPLEPFVKTSRQSALVALAASPWAPLVAVGGPKQVVLYNTETADLLGVLPFPEGFPAIIRFSRNGQLLLTGGGVGGKSGRVVLWDIKSGERIATLGNEFDQVLAADLSPNQQFVALGGPNRLVKIYSTKDGKLVHTIKKHTDWVTAMAYSPDGKFLASADRNGGIEVWEAASGKEFNTMPGHKVMVTSLAFMTGVLASSSEDGSIKLWDVKEAKEIRTWAAHAGGAAWVDFTPDGRLASSGRDKVAKAWDQTGKLLGKIEGFKDIALRATLQGDSLIAGDWTGDIRLAKLDGATVTDLPPNPAPIADNLALARKKVVEAEVAAAAKQKEFAAGEEALKVEQAAATKSAADDKLALEAAQKAVPEAEKQIAASKEQLEALRKERDALPEAERPPLQAKVDERKAAITKLETDMPGLKKAVETKQADLAAHQKTAEEKLKAATELRDKAKASHESAVAAIASAKAQVERWNRGSDYFKLYQARSLAAEKERLAQSRKSAAEQALAPIQQIRDDIVAADKFLAEAPAKTKESEAAAASAQQKLAELKKGADQEGSTLSQREERIKALAIEVPAAEKASTDAAKKVEAQTPKVAQVKKVADEAAPEAKEAALAKLKAAQDELARLNEAATAAKTAAEGLKKTSETVQAETDKSREVVAKLQLQLKQAQEVASSTQKTLEALRAKSVETKAAVAKMRAEEPKVIATAKAAKIKAEQEAVLATKELDAAKKMSEETRTKFESRWSARS